MWVIVSEVVLLIVEVEVDDTGPLLVEVSQRVTGPTSVGEEEAWIAPEATVTITAIKIPKNFMLARVGFLLFVSLVFGKTGGIRHQRSKGSLTCC